jgi:hypothetical protein
MPDPGQEPAPEHQDRSESAPEDSTPDAVPAPDEFDPERAMRTIRKLREEIKGLNKAERENERLKTRVAEFEDAQKSDEQKRDEELERLRSVEVAAQEAERKLALQAAVLDVAPSMGITDITLALAALDGSAIEYDKGTPQNVSDALEAVVERHPALRQASEPPRTPVPSTDAKEGSGDGKGPELTADQLAAAERFGMKPEDFAKWADPAAGAAALAAVNPRNSTG